MKSLFATLNASLSSKFVLVLFLGAVPFITNCSKYGESNKQAPLPPLAPKAAPAAAKVVTPATTKSNGVAGKMTDIDTKTTSDSVPTSSNATKQSDSASISLVRDFHDTTPTNHVYTIGGGCNPCSAQTQVQQAIPVQTVACPGGDCHKSWFTQAYMSPVQNVDILFVIDSNELLKDQRFMMFHHIESFLSHLPTNLNYHFAVLNTQDANGSLYNAASNLNKVVVADLTSLNPEDRDRTFESAKQDIWDRIATLSTTNFIGTSEVILKKLEFAITSPELDKNQALGFFRPDAGLVVVSLTDEKLSNQTPHPECSDLAFRLYQKMENMKASQDMNHIRQILPIEMIGFAYLTDENGMNYSQKVHNSDLLELLHLADGVVFDLARANANKEQMKADLRFSGDQVFNMWMKRRFQLTTQSADPKSVCFIANNQLLPTSFVPELNEIRVDYKAIRASEANATGGSSTAVLWCENGQLDNNSQLNKYRVNDSCIDLAAKFNQQ